jgi:dolichol-phosphate mannosyltransferase
MPLRRGDVTLSIANTRVDGSKGVFVNLPVLNESENIGPLLDAIQGELAGRDYTICVIDDGSRDGTLDIVRSRIAASGSRIQLLSRRKTARGCQRGAALLHGLQWGLKHTDHAYFVEIDGDFSHRPEELNIGLAMLESGRCDVVVASKYLRESRTTNRPIGRRLVSAICNIGVRLFVSRAVSDYSNGYRFYTRSAGSVIPLYEIRHGSPIYLTEAMAIWLSRGQRISEFASVYIGRNEGLSKVQWIDLVKGTIAVFDVALRYHFRGFAPSGSTAASLTALENVREELP